MQWKEIISVTIACELLNRNRQSVWNGFCPNSRFTFLVFILSFYFISKIPKYSFGRNSLTAMNVSCSTNINKFIVVYKKIIEFWFIWIQNLKTNTQYEWFWLKHFSVANNGNRFVRLQLVVTSAFAIDSSEFVQNNRKYISKV